MRSDPEMRGPSGGSRSPRAPGLRPGGPRDDGAVPNGTPSGREGEFSGLSDKLDGTQAFGMLVDVGDDDELVGSGFLNQRAYAFTDRIRRADNGARQHPHRLRLLHRCPIALDVVDRRAAPRPRAA